MQTHEAQSPEKAGQSAPSTQTAHTQGVTPVIIDLGKKSKKAIRNLKDVRGKLYAEVADAIKQHSTPGTGGGDSRPIVVLYRRKAKKKSSGCGLLPFMPPPLNLFR